MTGRDLRAEPIARRLAFEEELEQIRSEFFAAEARKLRRVVVASYLFEILLATAALVTAIVYIGDPSAGAAAIAIPAVVLGAVPPPLAAIAAGLRRQSYCANASFLSWNISTTLFLPPLLAVCIGFFLWRAARWWLHLNGHLLTSSPSRTFAVCFLIGFATSTWWLRRPRLAVYVA